MGVEVPAWQSKRKVPWTLFCRLVLLRHMSFEVKKVESGWCWMKYSLRTEKMGDLPAVAMSYFLGQEEWNHRTCRACEWKPLGNPGMREVPEHSSWVNEILNFKIGKQLNCRNCRSLRLYDNLGKILQKIFKQSFFWAPGKLSSRYMISVLIH